MPLSGHTPSPPSNPIWALISTIRDVIFFLIWLLITMILLPIKIIGGLLQLGRFFLTKLGVLIRGNSVSFQDYETKIESKAFQGKSSIETINFPPNLFSIGEEAFDGCAGIKSMTIPRGVTRIESKTFAFCINLSNLTFSGPLTFIGDEAFLSCYMMSQLTIPDTVQEIGDRAFMLCEQLRTLTLPEQFCTQQERARLGIDPSVQCIPHASHKDTPEPVGLRR
ncbi:leucine-rich repeat domain-containing protein [Gammaproteobacteria bacterium]|nr:leucine-rich repeat domain-containing protein [Gammaproteobacteria bacterium]